MWPCPENRTSISEGILPMERCEIQKRCILLAMALFALGGCGGDDPTEPIPESPKPLVFRNLQEAVLVIGQLDMSGTGPNLGDQDNPTGPIGLANPGSASTGLPLFVADSINDRVLGFNGFPQGNGQPADFALGQEDLISHGPGTTATTMDSPRTAVVAAGKLFVADIGNQRILIWNSIPRSNVPADVVIGQLDFTTVPPTHLAGPTAGSFNPLHIAVSGGKIFAIDFFNNRVLIWNTIPTENGVQADVVVGQTDFTSNGSGLSATALNRPDGIWASATKLVISDTDNNRLLIYNTIPTENGAAADVVVGAPDFDTVGPRFAGSGTFNAPGGVTSDGANLFVADVHFHRILIFDFPTANGATAKSLLGQSNFFLSGANDSDQDGDRGPAASGRTFQFPSGLTINSNKLIVIDGGNNRLLVFESN